jgi:hypothetical protein
MRGGVRHPDRERVFLGIRGRLDGMLPWLSEPRTCTTFFERLVGPSGGGSRTAQLHELGRIYRHLGVPVSPAAAGAIADRLFGGTSTFREGAIGGWRRHFTEEHKTVCKDVIGDLLIDLGYERDRDW